MLVIITDLDRGWLVGETESVTYTPSVNFNKTMFGSISLVSQSGYEWPMCRNVKSESKKVTCTTIVPADEQFLKGPLMVKGYWTDCKDGLLLGPILCDGKGSDVSVPFRIYSDVIPSTSSTSTSLTPTISTTKYFTSSYATIRKTSTATPSSSSSINLYSIGLILGILILLVCLGILGFIFWAKNQTRKERDLHDLLNFEIDTSHHKPFPKSIPKAESPFPTRPMQYQSHIQYGPMDESYQGYLSVNSQEMNDMNAGWNH